MTRFDWLFAAACLALPVIAIVVLLIGNSYYSNPEYQARQTIREEQRAARYWNEYNRLKGT